METDHERPDRKLVGVVITILFLDLQLEEEKKQTDLQISLGASPSAHEGASAVLGCCCFPSKSLCSASPIFRLGTNGAVTPVTGDPVLVGTSRC